MKASFSPIYLLLTLTFSICLIVSNLVEFKTIDIGWFTITAGVIVFPISYIISDCVTEVYGFARARFMIWVGFAASLFVTLVLQLAILLPGSPDFLFQDAMETVYGVVPRMMGASFVAFICGTMVNVYTMSRLKQRDGSEHRFRYRAILSTIFGEGLDSLIFFPLAFAGTLPLGVIVSLIVTQTCIKTLYEVLVLPVTVRIVKRLKRAEGDVVDRIDNNVSYKWWKINEL